MAGSRFRRSYETAADFRRALRHFQGRTEEICRARGLTADQYTLLLMVKGMGNRRGLSIGELAASMRLAHNGMVARVQRAEAAGLLVRERSDADRRVSIVRLTPEGERRMKEAFRALGEESDRLIAFMAEVDREDRRRARSAR
jgi:DNA-binding MarR family transcriptional regulator